MLALTCVASQVFAGVVLLATAAYIAPWMLLLLGIKWEGNHSIRKPSFTKSYQNNKMNELHKGQLQTKCKKHRTLRCCHAQQRHQEESNNKQTSDSRETSDSDLGQQTHKNKIPSSQRYPSKDEETSKGRVEVAKGWKSNAPTQNRQAKAKGPVVDNWWTIQDKCQVGCQCHDWKATSKIGERKGDEQ